MKGNAGECQGNVSEWRQSARGMQGNAGEYRGIQGNTGEYRGIQWNASGTYGSGCKVPGVCRELPGDCKGAGVKC